MPFSGPVAAAANRALPSSTLVDLSTSNPHSVNEATGSGTRTVHKGPGVGHVMDHGDRAMPDAFMDHLDPRGATVRLAARRCDGVVQGWIIRAMVAP